MGKNKSKTKAAKSSFGFAYQDMLNGYTAEGLMPDMEPMFSDTVITKCAEPKDLFESITVNTVVNDTVPKVQPAQSANDTNPSKMPIVRNNKKKVADSSDEYQSELEDGDFLAESLADNYRFDVNVNKWRFYNGQIWTTMRIEKMHRIAANIFKERYRKSKKIHGFSDKLLKQYQADSNMSNVKTALAYAMSSDLIEREHFDINKEILVVANGALNTHTGVLMPHDPEYWATKMVDLEYRKNAFKKSRFKNFLKEIFVQENGEPAKDVIQYVQNILGGAILGKPPQLFFMFSGDGSNGKSVFLLAVSEVLKQYTYQLPAAELSTKPKNSSSHSAFWVKTNGMRLVVSSELEKGATLNEAYLKNITGGSPLSLRDVGGKGIEFKAEFTLVIDTNELPRLQGKDFGIKRRTVVVPFRRRFEAWEEDPTLLDTLKTPAEQEAILVWLIEGAMRVAENPKIYKEFPDDVYIETEAFRNLKSVEELIDDVFLGFLNECTVEAIGNGVLSNKLHKVFKRFCKVKGHKTFAGIQEGPFGRKLSSYWPDNHHTNTGTLYDNLDVVDEWRAYMEE